jgi:hypothetical protein
MCETRHTPAAVNTLQCGKLKVGGGRKTTVRLKRRAFLRFTVARARGWRNFVCAMARRSIAVSILVAWLLFTLIASGAPQAFAQLAPTGEHYAGRASDTGYGGTVANATGTFATAIPLELPPARGGLSIPLQITYGARGVGAAGLGWDIPLSYIQHDRTFAHRRPESTPGPCPTRESAHICRCSGKAWNSYATGALGSRDRGRSNSWRVRAPARGLPMMDRDAPTRSDVPQLSDTLVCGPLVCGYLSR